MAGRRWWLTGYREKMYAERGRDEKKGGGA